MPWSLDLEAPGSSRFKPRGATSVDGHYVTVGSTSDVGSSPRSWGWSAAWDGYGELTTAWRYLESGFVHTQFSALGRVGDRLWVGGMSTAAAVYWDNHRLGIPFVAVMNHAGDIAFAKSITIEDDVDLLRGRPVTIDGAADGGAFVLLRTDHRPPAPPDQPPSSGSSAVLLRLDAQGDFVYGHRLIAPNAFVFTDYYARPGHQVAATADDEAVLPVYVEHRGYEGLIVRKSVEDYHIAKVGAQGVRWSWSLGETRPAAITAYGPNGVAFVTQRIGSPDESTLGFVDDAGPQRAHSIRSTSEIDVGGTSVGDLVSIDGGDLLLWAHAEGASHHATRDTRTYVLRLGSDSSVTWATEVANEIHFFSGGMLSELSSIHAPYLMMPHGFKSRHIVLGPTGTMSNRGCVTRRSDFAVPRIEGLLGPGSISSTPVLASTATITLERSLLTLNQEFVCGPPLRDDDTVDSPNLTIDPPLLVCPELAEIVTIGVDPDRVPADFSPRACNDDDHCPHCLRDLSTGEAIANPPWRARLYRSIDSVLTIGPARANRRILTALYESLAEVPCGRWYLEEQRKQLLQLVDSLSASAGSKGDGSKDGRRFLAMLGIALNDIELDLVAPSNLDGKPGANGRVEFAGGLVRVGGLPAKDARSFNLSLRNELSIRASGYQVGFPSLELDLFGEAGKAFDVVLFTGGLRFRCPESQLRIFQRRDAYAHDITVAVDTRRHLILGSTNEHGVFAVLGQSGQAS